MKRHLLGLLLVMAVPTACGSDRPLGDVEFLGGTAPTTATMPKTVADPMPPNLRAAYIATVQARASKAYWVAEAEGLLWANNPAQGFSAELSTDGVRVTPADASAAWTLALDAERYGCEGDARRLRKAQPKATENRIEYDRVNASSGEGLVEWYVNGPLGLEQGFTLPRAPSCETSGNEDKLVIELRLGGGLSATLQDAGREVALRDERGTVVLQYTDLHVHDATGREMASRLGLVDERLSLYMDARGVAYPVTVDPLIATEQTKLVASDGAVGDTFGYSVAMSGDTSVVGAYADDGSAADSGSAYAFVRSGDTWTEQAKLLASDGAVGDIFGEEVAVSGDTAVVSARNRDDLGTDSGSAYVFVRTGVTWAQQAKLLASDGAASDYFGISVAVSGDTVVVGTYNDDEAGSGSGSGSAYVFVRIGQTWTQQAKLFARDGTANAHFGISVAVSGDTAVVGTQEDDDLGSDSGSAYVFARTGLTWIQQAKLLANDGAANDYFGCSVTLSGDTAVVGARHNDHLGLDSGAAYVFVRSGVTWTEQAKLLPSDGAADDLFGSSVAVSGDRAVIGAYANDELGFNSGSAYVFARSGVTWTEQAKLLASDGAVNDLFGSSVAVFGDTAVVGAHNHDALAADSGSAYVYTLNGGSCSTSAACVSGFCSDGVCCDTACTSTCSACSAAKKGAGADGVCEILAAGIDPDNECDDEGTVACGTDGFCDGAGACSKYPNGTACAGASCVDTTTLAGADLCDGNGVCVDDGTDDCTPFACFAGACLTNCTTDTQCADTGYCDESICRDQQTNGTACTDEGQCASGYCAHGVCCDSACTAVSCKACSVIAGAPTDGTCVNLTGRDCDDRDACTGMDSCQSGTCAGTPIECARLDDCHVAGFCDPENGACSNPVLADGTSCEGGTCESGSCAPAATDDGGASESASSSFYDCTAAPGRSGATEPAWLACVGIALSAIRRLRRRSSNAIPQEGGDQPSRGADASTDA